MRGKVARTRRCHDQAIPPIRILHLVWAPLGPEALRGFLAALHEHPPGAPAALSVILNGFPSRGAAGEHLALLEDSGAELTWTPEPRQDLGAYAWAAAQVREPLLCLMNSYARPLRAGWLARLAAALEGGASAASATGSWESHASELRLGDRLRAGRGLRDRLGGAIDWAAYRGRFPRFPNPHLRTNGFLGPRELLDAVARRPPHTKLAAYEVESGRNGLSRRACSGGGRIVVVGRDGRAYGPDEWPASRTWRAGEQENLLIADNRTGEWAGASAGERAAMARRSWGAEGR